MKAEVEYDREKIEAIIHDYTKRLLQSAFKLPPQTYQVPPSIVLCVDEIERALFHDPETD